MFKFPFLRLWSIAYAEWTPSIVPTASGDDQTIYLVVNIFGHLGTAFTETDVERADLETSSQI
jgi:hypothetical protein